MKKTYLFFGFLMAFLQASYGQNDLDHFLIKTDALYQKIQKGDKIDYAGINLIQLNDLVNDIGNFNLNPHSFNEQKIFYIYAYNILVIKQIRDNFKKAKTPIEIDGFFTKTKFKVAQESMTLDHLENTILRIKYADPRLHFVLSCGANSCPPTSGDFISNQNMDQELEGQTRKIINDKQFVRVNHITKTVHISKIFEWYAEDFIKESGSIIDYINQYRENKIPKDYKIIYLEYDWEINSN